MKKLLALILAAVMLCGLLAGCGSSDKKSEGKEGSGDPVTTQPKETEPKETEPEIDAANVAFGVLEGDTYINRYAGFQVTMDSSWMLMTSDELQELPADVVEMFEDSAIGETVKNYTQFYDMQATSTSTLASVNVLYQVKDSMTAALGNVFTEEQIVDVTLAQKDLLISTYQQAGIEVESMEKVKVQFLGAERFAVKTTATVMGMDYYLVQLFDYTLGDYAVIYTFAAFTEAEMDANMALFQPLS